MWDEWLFPSLWKAKVLSGDNWKPIPLGVLTRRVLNIEYSLASASYLSGEGDGLEKSEKL